jgi:uncharacterized protein
MKPRITFLTIGVDDLDRSFAFYHSGLGLPSKGIVGREFEQGAAAFFELHGGLTLAIFPRASLAHDAGIRVTPPSASEFAIAHNARSEQEVDDVMREAERAGAAIVKRPQKTFWGGYAGYFADPDGHLWEVAFNPSAVPED